MNSLGVLIRMVRMLLMWLLLLLRVLWLLWMLLLMLLSLLLSPWVSGWLAGLGVSYLGVGHAGDRSIPGLGVLRGSHMGGLVGGFTKKRMVGVIKRVSLGVVL